MVRVTVMFWVLVLPIGGFTVTSLTRRVTWSSGTAGWQKIVVGLRVYFAGI